METVKTAKIDQLQVYLCESREVMAACAARDVIHKIKELAKQKDTINMMFAAAPSQNEFLENLAKDTSIPWEKVNAFHMDEYLGNHKFAAFLKQKLFDKVKLKNTFLLNGCCNNPEEECNRYAGLLKKSEMDIVCMGIGENGHIAFNDPHIADFHDLESVKVVELDEKCRVQQVNDGCFTSIDKVPAYAITITVPALIHANQIYCIVPDIAKADAVSRTLSGEISEECPASVLRNLNYAMLYLDCDSGKKVRGSVEWEKTERL